MKNVEKIKPSGIFTNYIYKAIPLAFDESMSYYETLCGLLSYLKDTVIPTLNNNADAIIEVQNLMQNLQNYVDNYFDNLDVQKEINNKLDEMAESGELTELILQYIKSQAILGFNNNSSLASATNLANGSFAKTYGKITYNDGQGAFYKIRTKTNADVPDGDTLIVLTNTENLVAEMIPYSRTYDISQEIEEVSNNLDDTILTDIVVFGDSWSDLNVTDAIWSNYVANTLHLNLRNYAISGAGFIKPTNKQIITQINNYINDTTINKNKAKYIILLGGINDYKNDVNTRDLSDTIANNISILLNNCPNAKILYVSNCEYPYTIKQSGFWIELHDYISTKQPISTLNLDGIIGGRLFNTANYFHLTQNGQKFMARNIINALCGGEIIKYKDELVLEDNEIKITYSSERSGNMALISLTFRPKVNLSTKTFTFENNSLSYYDYLDTFGCIGVGYNLIIADIQSDKIIIAGQSELKENRNYYINGCITL